MSFITGNDAQDDIFAAFDSYFTALHPLILLAYPNRPFDPATIAETVPGWVRAFTTGFTDGGHMPLSGSVATNFFQERGRIIFEIHTRQGKGTDLGRDLGDTIQGFLDGARTTHTIFQNRSALQAVGGDGAWYQQIVAADWLYFSDRAAP